MPIRVLVPPAVTSPWEDGITGVRLDINDSGVIAGTLLVGSNHHAFAWMPAAVECGDQIIDLNPGGEIDDSMATAINNDRWIAGGFGSTFVRPSAPAAWEPTGGSTWSFTDLTETGFEHAFCWGISESDWPGGGTAPVVVGEYSACELLVDDVHEAFWRDLAGGSFRAPLNLILTEPGLAPPQGISPSGEWWVGFQNDTIDDPCASEPTLGIVCGQDDDLHFGLYWEFNPLDVTPAFDDVSEVDFLDPEAPDYTNHVGTVCLDGDERSIIASGDRLSTGYGTQVYLDGFFQCQRHWLVWDLVAVDYTDLHALVPDPAELSEGVAIKELDDGRLFLLGFQHDGNSQFAPLVAEHDGGDDYEIEHWCVAALAPFVKNCDNQLQAIVQAQSLNRYGYIVAVARFSDPEGVHLEAVRLVNLADLDADGFVDGDDLGTLLGLWDSSECLGDLDGDEYVDGSDLGTFFGNWSDDEPASVGSICDVECGAISGDDIESFAGPGLPSDPEAAEAWLAARLVEIGFESIAAFVQWGQEATTAQLELVAILILDSEEQ